MNQKIRAVVCFLIKDDRINLPVKKSGFGKGYRNGYGGKMNPGESPAEAAVRETLEESRTKTFEKDLRPVALLRTEVQTGEGVSAWVVRVFETGFWLSAPKETYEMGPPEWFSASGDSLPETQLMPADRVWLPRFLRSRKLLVVTFRYDSFLKLNGEVVVEEVAALPEE